MRRRAVGIDDDDNYHVLLRHHYVAASSRDDVFDCRPVMAIGDRLVVVSSPRMPLIRKRERDCFLLNCWSRAAKGKQIERLKTDGVFEKHHHPRAM